MQDTGHILFDNYGCGEEARNKLDEQIKSGERSFRDVSEEMWGSLHVPFDDGFVVMEKTLEIDPGFREFHQYCIDNGFPFNVISAGLKPVLRRVLDTFLGEKEVHHNPNPRTWPRKKTVCTNITLPRPPQSTSSPTTL
jgi:2-hydroxy-3-keto-5-methylthiopentenyl-1-phosphate phosphatase